MLASPNSGSVTGTSDVPQQRVDVAEARQNQMMAFLSKALQNPGMLQQLVSSRQSIGRLENGTASGRTREPNNVPLAF